MSRKKPDQSPEEITTPHLSATGRPPLFSEDHELDQRHIWATVRIWMEADNFKYLRLGGKRKHHWNLFEKLIHAFGCMLKVCGLYERGIKNALNIQIHRKDLYFQDLPQAFDGYTIMHLTDLHYDSLTGIDDVIIRLLDGIEVDLCAFTGDYRMEVHGSYMQILPAMEKVVAAIRARDGIVATLGNHDTAHMVNAFEKMGVRVLGNETLSLQRDKQHLHVTGIDDVHYYYTDMVLEALEACQDGFKVALVHSPEIYDLADHNGYALYLAGHTHAGQIVLPNKRPIISHLNKGKHLAAGLWKHGKLIGYTSSGVGASGLPIRFNTRGEISIFTLRKKCVAVPTDA